MTTKSRPKKIRKPKPPAGPPLWPGLVADVFRYRPFPFPGDPAPPPTPLPLVALGELVRKRAEMIEKPRIKGMSDVVWVCALAGELLDWIAGMSAEGCEYAQAELVHLSGKAVDYYTWSLSHGHEVPLKKARHAPDIPGRVSLNPEVTAYWQAFLERVRQGSETPVPMKRAANEKRSKRDVCGANHRLAASLFDYMQGYRRYVLPKLFAIPSDHPEIPERVREILSLPSLGLKGDAWKAWHKVGLKIVKDWTQGNPATHEAFKRPALSSLMNLTGQGKHTLSRDMPAAWKALAMAKGSLVSGE